MCTGGPRNPGNPQRAQPAQARQGRASAPCQRDPRTNRIPPACAGLHRSRGRSPHWAANRGQAADMSELPLRILMQSPAPAFVISHAARHMAERWYPSSGRFRSPSMNFRQRGQMRQRLRAYLPPMAWAGGLSGRGIPARPTALECRPHGRQVPRRLSIVNPRSRGAAQPGCGMAAY